MAQIYHILQKKQGTGSDLLATGTVTVTGTPTENETLTVTNTITDPNGIKSITYQWQRDGVDISGATNNTYTLVAADVGTTITVVATMTDNYDNTQTFTSDSVGPIAVYDWVNPPVERKIQASDRQVDDNFGAAVAISADGNTAIVGKATVVAIPSGAQAGSAYIFTRSGSTWIQQQKLLPSDAQSGDYFGYSVTISADGNTAIVGAIYEDTSGAEAGAAYVFTRSGSTWTQQQKIQSGDIEAGDSFGYSVSISANGNTAIIGARGETSSGFNGGAAYIFTRSGSTWTQQQKLLAGTPTGGDAFGGAVSISADGNTVLIGASAADPDGAAQAGVSYVFTRSGSVWTQQQKLQASDGDNASYFGRSVSISPDGTAAVIGAPEQYTGAVKTGAAYIFTRNGSTWTEQQKILASDGAHDDFYGWSVSMSEGGNAVIVGARLDNSFRGAAYVFTRNGSTWTEQRKITASDASSTDYFGYSVSIDTDGNTAMVGAWGEDTGAQNAGAAYIYSGA